MKVALGGRASSQTELVCSLNPRRGGPVVEYLGIDWSYRRAAWCSLSDAGVIVGEGPVPSDADGLARLVIERGIDVRAVVEMMSGAIWVRDELAVAGWRVQIAHARKVRDVAPLVCKTDKATRACWPSSPVAISCPSRGSRRWKTASCVSGCGGGRTWSGCAPRR